MKDINNENLMKIIEDTLENDEKQLLEIILNIVTKIIDLKKGKKTSIAKLINYNPNISFVEPLRQGKIFYHVKEICKNINIQLQRIDDSVGGLAYFYEFKKC